MAAFAAVYRGIRKHPLLHQSTILFVLENNLGNEAPSIAAHVRSQHQFENCVCLQEHAEIVGFRSTRQSKFIADKHLQRLISTQAIGFIKDVVTVNQAPHRGLEDVKRMFSAQMNAMYQYEETKPGHPTSAYISSIFTADKKRKVGVHDDLQRAFSLAIFAAYAFYERSLPMNYTYIYGLQLNNLNYTREYKRKAARVANRTEENENAVKRLKQNEIEDHANAEESGMFMRYL